MVNFASQVNGEFFGGYEHLESQKTLKHSDSQAHTTYTATSITTF